MTARSLLVVFDSVYLLALTAWVGSILFFSFGVAPIIFKVLGAEAGGRFVRALFPRYYLGGDLAGRSRLPAALAVPLASPSCAGRGSGSRRWRSSPAILIMLYAGNSLTPAINAARDAGPAGAGAVRPAAPALGPAQRPGAGAGPGPADRLRRAAGAEDRRGSSSRPPPSGPRPKPERLREGRPPAARRPA